MGAPSWVKAIIIDFFYNNNITSSAQVTHIISHGLCGQIKIEKFINKLILINIQTTI